MSSPTSPTRLRSLGIASDLVALGDRAVIETHGDRVVVRMPAEPDYWSGNKLILRDLHPAAETVAMFRSDFPEAEHINVEWDIPGLSRGPVHDAAEAMGFELEVSEVMVCDTAPAPAPTPEGIEIRPVAAGDWAQVEALQLQITQEEGLDHPGYAEYLTRRFAAFRRQASAGRAAWFGAFDGDTLVGDMGMCLGFGIGRYQSVKTRPAYRRRGVAAALLSAAGDWARGQGAERLVIIADPGTDGARLYAARGFRPVETFLGMLRRPAAAGQSDAAVE